MGFRAAFTSAIRAVSRPHLILPAAFVAVHCAVVAAGDRRRVRARLPDARLPRGLFRRRVRAASSRPMNGRDDVQVGDPSGRKSGRVSRAATTSSPAPACGKGGMGGMGGMGMGGRHPPARTPPTRGTRRAITVRRAGRASDPADLSCRRRHRRRRCRAVRRRVRRPTSVAVVAVAASRRRRHPRNPTSRPPTGAAMCRTRWWSRSRPTSRRRPSTRCCAGIASRSSRRSTCNPAARRSAACGSTTGAAVPAVVRALAAEGFMVQPNLIATLQEAAAAPASSVPISSNMRWRACGCRRRIRSPPATAC